MATPGTNSIVELRQYTLKPAQRDTLIALFEREFVESQEDQGMELIGTFRDLDHEDRFVWLRGFPDMESRAASLAAFYGGPVWKAHREAANATMIDSDNVLLLKPAWDGAGFKDGAPRAPRGSTERPRVCVTATICPLAQPANAAWREELRATLPAQCRRTGARFAAAFVTEPGPNNFPALPVREGENVLVWFDVSAEGAAMRMPAPPPSLGASQACHPEVLRLQPTARCRRFWT